MAKFKLTLRNSLTMVLAFFGSLLTQNVSAQESTEKADAPKSAGEAAKQQAAGSLSAGAIAAAVAAAAALAAVVDSGDGGGNWSAQYDAELNPIIKLINDENFEDALLELEVFVYANPQSADGWNYIGFVSRQLEKFEDAERYYELGLEINPKHKGILEYQ